MRKKYVRVGFTAAQNLALWERWRKGESLKAIDRDLMCGEHYGQRPSMSAGHKGRTDGSTDQLRIAVQKCLAYREPSTDGLRLPLAALG